MEARQGEEGGEGALGAEDVDEQHGGLDLAVGRGHHDGEVARGRMLGEPVVDGLLGCLIGRRGCGCAGEEAEVEEVGEPHGSVRVVWGSELGASWAGSTVVFLGY